MLIFLPNFIKINPYNFELYCLKVLRQCYIVQLTQAACFCRSYDII